MSSSPRASQVGAGVGADGGAALFASDWVEHGDEPRGAPARVAQEIAAQRLNIVRRHVFHRAHIACENLFLDLTIRRKVKSQNLLFEKP